MDTAHTESRSDLQALRVLSTEHAALRTLGDQLPAVLEV